MSFGITVKGGTGAGRKRPLMPANTIPWACECVLLHDECDDADCLGCGRSKMNPGYLKRCINCGTSRDPS